MTKKPQAEFALHALAAALPETGDGAPQWITIFPKLGEIVTRDERRYIIDAAALTARFAADGVDLPIDVNHATDMAAFSGGRSDAVGWISQLRVEGGALQGKVEWLDEGKALLAAKKYRFVSPSFHHTQDGRSTWLKAVALVTAPALGNQAALAHATQQENSMDKLAAALGLSAGASQDAMLAALGGSFVSKAVHDETLAKLTAASAELTTIKDAARKAEIDALLDGAVKEKKILPAQKEHYAGLCATDAGLTSVKALLAATAPVLGASGLDGKKTPEGGGEKLNAAQLAAKANKMVADGEAPDFITAVGILDDQQSRAA